MPDYFDTTYEFGGPEPRAPLPVTLRGLLAEFVAALWVPFVRRAPEVELAYAGHDEIGNVLEGWYVGKTLHRYRNGYHVRA